jgi:hypothetical protein
MLLRDLASLISLLNDDVARSGLDHGLQLVELVAVDDDEPPGMGAHVFVLADGQLDQLVAAEAGALAPEGDGGVLFPRPLSTLDALVDIADGCFIGGRAPLLLALH